jgi:hypothetical protein
LGREWLAGQQDARGAFPSVIASDMQSTAEARAALLADLPDRQTQVAAATAFLESVDTPLNESLARAHGASTTVGSYDFWAARSANPGWGDFADYPASDSSTAMVLQTAAQRQWQGAAVDEALNLLKTRQLPSGGWSQPPNPESLLVTTYATDALRQFQFSHSVSSALQRAVNFLVEDLAQRGDEVELYQQAAVLRAVAPFLSDTGNVSGVVTLLESSQRLDGSWQGDSYTTALAIQALAAVDGLRKEQGAQRAAIYGRLVDAASGLPVAGERVVLGSDGAGRVVSTDASGSFFFGALTAGSYTVSLQSAEWQPLSVMLSLADREFRSTGDLLLVVPDGQYRLSGVVSRADTLAPISGARLQFSGTDPRIRTSRQNGTFGAFFPTLPSSVALSKPTFISDNASLAGVQSGAFVPLVLQPEEPAGEASDALSGRILDAVSGQPVAGAQVGASLGSVMADAQGHFVLESFAAGMESVQVSAPGYQSLDLDVFTGNSPLVNLGDLYLRPLGPAPSVVHGRVVHAVTGDPIYGARVDLAGQFASTSLSGEFAMTVTPGQALGMSVSAPGFLPVDFIVDTAAIGEQGLTFAMQPAGRGNVVISEWSGNSARVKAYQPVIAAADLTNEGAETTRVLLFAKVYDADGDIVDSFPVPVDLASGDYALQLSPGETSSIEVRWFTRNHPPGDYQLEFQVHSERGLDVWAKRQFPLVIESTQRIDNARLYASPTAIYGDTVQPVTFFLNARNRSNVAWTLPVSYSLVAPDDEVVYQGSSQLELQPATLRIEDQLAQPSLGLQQPGRYTLVPVGPSDQQIAGGFVDRLPDIRIELDASLAPGTVTPDGDKVIRATIELSGEEAP